MTQKELEKLVADYDGDSKRLAEEAEEKLLETISLVLKRFYKISRHFKTFVKPFTKSGDYLPDRGSLSSILDIDDTGITVYYKDYMKGGEYEDELTVPFEWLIDTDTEAANYFEECRKEGLMKLQKDTTEHQRAIDFATQQIETIKEDAKKMAEDTYEAYLETLKK